MNGPMHKSVLILIVAGFVCFGAGAYLSATGERPIGIALMAAGLAFQVLSLARMRRMRLSQKGEGS
jgi:hypothetical protein